MSDPSHWWPGPMRGGEETSGRQDRGNPGGGTVPPGPTSGGYYYPPGTTPGGRGPGSQPPAPTRRGVSRRGWTWLAIGVAVGAILVSTHRVTRDEVILFCVIVPSIILHEVAHGWVALAFGDDTAKRAGRLTLNPVAHIDVVGTVIVPILMILSGFGWFGWAKPVPVDLSRLRSPRNHGVLVSLAGPATNVVLCVASAVAFHLFGGVAAVAAHPASPPLWVLILFYLGVVNVWLTIFNMIPIPPLDGSVLVERLLPASWWPRYLSLRRYTLPVVLMLVVLVSLVHVGNTTLFGHLSQSTINWWMSVLGLG